MKYLILASFILFSCGKIKPITVEDGCEYISVQGDPYTHKGNCKNPVHYFKNDETIYKYNIVMPKDYHLITTDKKKPDTLIAYASQDSIYLELNR